MMNSKKDRSQLTGSIFEDLIQLTKSALYRIAQTLGIPGRSTMSKSELIDVLSKTTEETSAVMETIQKKTSTPIAEALTKIPSATSASERPKTATIQTIPSHPGPTHPGQIPPVAEKQPEPMSAFSSMPAGAPAPALHEPEGTWVGEEGPELPAAYGATVLRALPRDPHWVYLYWEITDETRNQIRSSEGEWIFDISAPCLRVNNGNGEIVQEIPVLLDAANWYLNVSPFQSYEFELGLRKSDGSFISIAKSNRITMPSLEPSSVTDEEWAMVSDEFEEVLYQSAGVDRITSGSSAAMIPQVMRHRMRVPWTWTAEQWPSSQVWPSSQAFLSSLTVVKNR